jgi:hypothetical protein
MIIGSTLRDALANTIKTTVGTAPKLRVYTGSAPAATADAATGTLLVEIDLPSDWLGAASAGVVSKAGTWSDAADGGTGSTPGYWRLVNTAGSTTHLQGSAGIGSGELDFDGTFTTGQTVTINTAALTMPDGS